MNTPSGDSTRCISPKADGRSLTQWWANKMVTKSKWASGKCILYSELASSEIFVIRVSSMWSTSILLSIPAIKKKKEKHRWTKIMKSTKQTHYRIVKLQIFAYISWLFKHGPVVPRSKAISKLRLMSFTRSAIRSATASGGEIGSLFGTKYIRRCKISNIDRCTNL